MRRRILLALAAPSLVVCLGTSIPCVISYTHPLVLRDWINSATSTSHTVWLVNGSFNYQTAVGVRVPPPNVMCTRESIRAWNVCGVHYSEWYDIATAFDGTRVPGNFGRRSSLWFKLHWIVLLTAPLPAWLLTAALVRRVRSTVRRDVGRCAICGFPRWPYGCAPCPKCGAPRLCNSCGYNLTGNTSSICPECGTSLI